MPFQSASFYTTLAGLNRKQVVWNLEGLCRELKFSADFKKLGQSLIQFLYPTSASNGFISNVPVIQMRVHVSFTCLCLESL